METFEKKSFWELRKMALEDLKKYYREFRKYEMQKDLFIEGIELRKKMHFLIRFILFLDKIASRRTVKIIGNKQSSCEQSKMFLGTHIGRYDIESALASIGENAWFIMGDPGKTYTDLNGLILRLNGVSWFDMLGNDIASLDSSLVEELKLDAHTVNVRQTKILLQGGNELSFPEQAWHMDPIIPVGEIHPGPIKRAIRTHSVIVPVAIEQYRKRLLKHYYVNIGENLDISGANESDVLDIAKEVRQKMIDLKWEIWDKYGQATRASIDKDWLYAYADFVYSIMCDTENGYTMDVIENTKYKSEENNPSLSSLRKEMDREMVKHLLKKVL